MSVLTNVIRPRTQSGCVTSRSKASSVPEIFRDNVSMDHLDALEAQSIYILREAFARLEEARDAVVARQGLQRHDLARAQGLLRPRAVPGDACRHRQEVPGDVRVPRPLRARSGSSICCVEPCPPIEAVDPTLPPAARSAARKTEGPEDRARQVRLRRLDRRHPPRRGGDARQGARVLAARPRRQMGCPRPAAGVLGPVQHRRRRRARICASIRSCIGPRSTSGATPSARTSRSFRSISPRTASATARSAMPTSPSRCRVERRDTSTRSSTELETTRVPERAGRAHGPRDRRRLRAPARRGLPVGCRALP